MQLLPDLCNRLDRARALAAAGKHEEAGRVYEGLLVSAQVAELAVLVWEMAEHADMVGQPGGQISSVIGTFANQMAPVLEAALSEDPKRIERVLRERGPAYGAWVTYLGTWASELDSGAIQVRRAKRIWDMAMLVIATYEAAVSAGQMAAAGRPPMRRYPINAQYAGKVYPLEKFEGQLQLKYPKANQKAGLSKPPPRATPDTTTRTAGRCNWFLRTCTMQFGTLVEGPS